MLPRTESVRSRGGPAGSTQAQADEDEAPVTVNRREGQSPAPTMANLGHSVCCQPLLHSLAEGRLIRFSKTHDGF